MRKLLYLLVMCSFVLWGCNKNDDIKNPEDPDNTTNVYLEVYPSELVFEAPGGEKSVRVGCFDDDANAHKWIITGGSEWCKTDVSEGNGYGEVIVTVDAYSETQDRNTNLTIKAGDKSFVLTVTQKHGDAIVLSKDKFDVPEEGGTVTVEVKSNIEYEVEVPDEFQDWIKQAPESRAVAEKSFTFTILENEDYDKREGYIIFKGNTLKDTVYIYQAQKNELVLNQSTYSVLAAGAEITVELRTNIDYEVRIPGDAASWISQISTKAIREDRLKFQIAANTGDEGRTAQIVIQDK
ncbi:MAG: BACON domain-containing protein, partial [Odoribacter sp.]|nr:BACON domain-containing protein [Odoribacter sp.]